MMRPARWAHSRCDGRFPVDGDVAISDGLPVTAGPSRQAAETRLRCKHGKADLRVGVASRVATYNLPPHHKEASSTQPHQGFPYQEARIFATKKHKPDTRLAIKLPGMLGPAG